jgi:hypothetical protein
MNFYMNFHEILHRFSPKFIKIHQIIETCSKLFPRITIIILKQPPPPIVPLPISPKRLNSARSPKIAKSRLKKGIDP